MCKILEKSTIFKDNAGYFEFGKNLKFIEPPVPHWTKSGKSWNWDFFRNTCTNSNPHYGKGKKMEFFIISLSPPLQAKDRKIEN